MKKRHTILLVDDHPILVEGIRSILSFKHRIELAANSQQAIKRASEHNKLSLVLLERTLPDADGMTVLSSLKRRCPNIPVAMLSMDENIETVRMAMKLGAAGYISKRQSAEKFRHAVDVLVAGDSWVSEDMRQHLATEQHSRENWQGLTPRQYDALRLLQVGLDNKGIAESLGISETTVKTHVSALFRALGARNRTMCVRTARQRGLLE